MALRILLADDNPVVRESLRSLVLREGFELVGEAVDGEEAVRRAAILQPDVVVLDLAMPKINGVSAAAEIRTRCPATHTILLTVHNASHLVMAGLRAGARGYIVKSEVAEHLGDAVRAVCLGGLFLSPSAARVVAAHYLPDGEAPASNSGKGGSVFFLGEYVDPRPVGGRR